MDAMDISQAEQEQRCAACGVHITTSGNRVFEFGEQSVLCYECAVSRGGVHEEDYDRWTSPPTVGDLLAIERTP